MPSSRHFIERLKFARSFDLVRNSFFATSRAEQDGQREPSAHDKLDRYSFFSSLIEAFKKLSPAVFLSSLIINVLGLALPIVILQIYDRVLTNKSYETLAWLMVSIFVVIVFEMLLKISRTHLMSWTATQEAFRSDMDVVSRMLYAPNRKITSENSSVWMSRLDAQGEVVSFSTGQSVLILLDIPFIAIFLTIAYLVAGPLAFVILGVVAAFAGWMFFKTRQLRTVLEERSVHDHRRYDFITESLMCIEAVKSSAMEPQMLRRFERLQKTSASITYRKNLITNELSAATNLMGNILLVLVVSFGAMMVITGGLSLGALACCTMLTSRLIQPLMRAIPVWIEIENASIARKKADKLFELAEVNNRATETRSVKGDLSLRGITFLKEGYEKPIFKDLTFDIPQGRMIGIDAEHSFGSSTLLDIISGDLEPQEGQILVDGSEVGEGRCGILSKHLVHLRHDSSVFQGTILENITMFREGAAVAKAREAARLINLEQDINRLPKGYDTRLGDGVSETLPPGLLQRIVIARALATDPKIVLFDEANSSIDLRSEKFLCEGLLKIKGRMTGIFVSSRPALLEVMDHVYRISDGKMIEVPKLQDTPHHQSNLSLSA